MKPAALVLTILTAFLSLTALAADAPKRVVLPTNVTPLHYDLAIIPDAAAKTFTGSVKIDIEVHEQTSRIELNAAELHFTHVALSGAAAEPAVTYDAAQETARSASPRPSRPAATRCRSITPARSI